MPSGCTAQFKPASFTFAADFVRRTLLPPLGEFAARATLIPLEPHWAVLADLFEPAPDQWGLRLLWRIAFMRGAEGLVVERKGSACCWRPRLQARPSSTALRWRDCRTLAMCDMF
jgi:hypothetical protein